VKTFKKALSFGLFQKKPREKPTAFFAGAFSQKAPWGKKKAFLALRPSTDTVL
jgi:hypothetical protein